jgi:hypothetical protein
MADMPDVTTAVAAQWRSAASAMAEIRRENLRQLTDEDAVEAAEELLDLVRFLPPRQGTSGMVEQQRIFARARG